MKKLVQAAWSGWRKVSGVIREAARMIGEVYKTMVRPMMLYGLGDWGAEEKTGGRVGGSRS